ncbi:hypothetical protein AGMMS50233_04130 [Endomicrobiia bacterium]|nr:hypothetical protein AGMMS50233_04130 [Endomicrobiia bacterium]
MMNFFRRHIRAIFIVTIVAFMVGIFWGPVSYALGPKDYIAKVNGTKIPISRYKNIAMVCSQLKNSQLSEEILNIIKDELIKEEIFYQQSKIYGIVVTDEELRVDIQNSKEFKDKNDVFSKDRFKVALISEQMSPKEYESLRKKQIAVKKVKEMIASSVRVWKHEFEEKVKQDSSITKDALKLEKGNILLNEWYSTVHDNSKIDKNEKDFQYLKGRSSKREVANAQTRLSNKKDK